MINTQFKSGLVRAGVVAGFLAAGSAAQAQFVAPDAVFRSQLSTLADAGVIALSTSTWPLSELAVDAALAAAQLEHAPQLAPVLAAARARLDQLTANLAYARLQTAHQPLASFGAGWAPGSGVGAQGRVWLGDVAVQWQGEVGHQPATPGVPGTGRSGVSGSLAGSAVAVHALGAVFSVGQLERFWGPGWQGSLVLGNAAPPVVGVAVQRALGGAPTTPWLQWVGPWNAVFFMGRLEGHTQPANPYLIAMRATVQPLPGLELGASRGIQWGGAGQSQSLGSFVDALLGRNVNKDNPSLPDTSNQLGGFDARWSAARWGLPVALYAQGMGEDAAGFLPSKYFWQFGAEAWGQIAPGQWRLALEFADNTANGLYGGKPSFGTTYANGTYKQGYTNDHLSLGYPAGGDARVVSAHGQLQTAAGAAWRIDAYGGTANRGNQLRRPSALTYPGSTQVAGGQLAWQTPWQGGASLLGLPVKWQLQLAGGVDWRRPERTGQSDLNPTLTATVVVREGRF